MSKSKPDQASSMKETKETVETGIALAVACSMPILGMTVLHDTQHMQRLAAYACTPLTFTMQHQKTRKILLHPAELLSAANSSTAMRKPAASAALELLSTHTCPAPTALATF